MNPIRWFLNLFRSTPKVGEIWLINGPNRKSLEGRITRVNDIYVTVEVCMFYMDFPLPINVTYKEFHQILKIKRINK